MKREQKEGACELCNKISLLTFHHLIPKSTHRNKWFKKKFTLEEMRTRGINICRKCHSHIHKTYSEKELGRNFNTLELILKDAPIMNYVEWAKKH
ncbi:hypothetical protein [Flammeovirga kamogawensis]|uniref:HNH endonuclease n=1 Tax=Flammeovirga kamogawensis TaxID=373891 RepID=A0ABX8GY30_9BACT|nr:hypothetical protein [Flammeovirga kamogawensis]MBB6460898.1 hypothetical protein [Flammeovirga kamogawensis]QWG08243.1 hypothetical protein KM029_04710 [Flammeovirga kamogawensis]TRX70046.1 hypothetical protein EO216_18645 [Flammeovirga kamogawensis]